MQVLIVGKEAKEYVLAKKIKEQNPDCVVFVAPGNQAICDFAVCVDIQATNAGELVEFAQANEVNLTIISDYEAIKTGVADAFNEAGLMVFAPEAEASRFCIFKSVGKKFMYKLKIPTPKFGIFDREIAARDYVRAASYPILIKSDEHEAGENVFLCHSPKEAENILNKFFIESDKKVVIQNYISGREFSFYAVTDGYNVLPVVSVVPYKYASEKDGGSITKGVGAYAPCTFADYEIEQKILNQVIYPALDEIAKNSSPYVGIIGADVILDNENNISVIEFNPFFKEPDIECILNLFNTGLINLFRACIAGSLIDDYDCIDIKDRFALSVVLTKIPEKLFDNESSLVTGLERLDDEIDVNLYNAVNKNNEIFVKAGRALSLCSSALTLNQARKNIADNIDCVEFKGKRIRKDILNINNGC